MEKSKFDAVRYFTDMTDSNKLAKKSGFIHIPFMTSQAVGKKGTPSMSLDEIVKGLTAAIGAIVKEETK